MERNTLIGTGVLILILAGIIAYAAMKPVPAKAPVVAALPLPAGSYTEHAAYYDIAANYATSTPLTGGADAAAISLMQNFVSDRIAQFKTDGNFANLTAEDIKMMGFDQGRKEKLQIVYLVASSPLTVSYIFTIYEDTLGAHGNTYFHTFTFDTTSGTSIALADIFTLGTQYLDKLSTISRAKLPAILGDNSEASFITDGTTSDDKNFENFFFDNKELVFIFPPYQVAPYSAGPQTLRIPLTELSNILKSEYR